MDDATQAGATLKQSLSWITMMLDYTDQVCESVPEDRFELRFTDPEGGYFFSAVELMMHIADSRWSVVSWISGGDHAGRKFQLEFGGKDKPWEFREGVTKADLTASLSESRVLIEDELKRPATEMLTVTDALQQSFDARIAGLKEMGKDTAEAEAAGPSNIANALMFLVAHEQSHRGELMWLMRSNGVDVFRFI